MRKQIYWEALAENTYTAFQALASASLPPIFYLAGGTALALQIGHRISYDLDFFSSVTTLDLGGRTELQRRLQSIESAVIRHEADGQMYATVMGVEVSFLHQHHPLLFSTQEIQGIQLAHPADIGLMKLAAVKDRGTRRDFIDLYCLRHEAPLSELFRLIPQKYPDRPDFTVHLAYALNYFEDAETDPRQLQVLKEVQWEAVKSYCRDGARLLSKLNAGLEPPPDVS
ncbi:MAG: nucleotidyl transferase AbiEii/AbiGii toxin family protein [Caldilineaceae bacterium]|nr:nucleotidyl transferase AbiEii/AbiGii toxin family protein [Caldilineaceae bacterium]